MGWAVGYDTNWKRWIGYGVPAYCDHPKCSEEIDRGLSYVCGGEPYGGEYGCGLHFCGKHLAGYNFTRTQACSRCGHYRGSFTPKPEHPTWVKHLLTDPSWAEWRAGEPAEVGRLKSGAA